MLLLSAWSTNGWLPSGHAMRMALDLGLHRALEKLADGGAKRRTEEEERDLGAHTPSSPAPADSPPAPPAVVSARIWLCLYWFDHQCVPPARAARPAPDPSPQNEPRHRAPHRAARRELDQALPPAALARDGVAHGRPPRRADRAHRAKECVAPPAPRPRSPRAAAQIYETLSPLNGQVNHNTLSFIRRAHVALDKWWADCDQLHGECPLPHPLPACARALTPR